MWLVDYSPLISRFFDTLIMTSFSAPAHLKLAKFLVPAIFVTAVMWRQLSALWMRPEVCLSWFSRMDQLVPLSPITMPLINSSVCWNSLHWRWPGIFCYTSRQEQNSKADFRSRNNAWILPIQQVYSLICYITCVGEMDISNRLNNVAMYIYT